ESGEVFSFFSIVPCRWRRNRFRLPRHRAASRERTGSGRRKPRTRAVPPSRLLIGLLLAGPVQRGLLLLLFLLGSFHFLLFRHFRRPHHRFPLLLLFRVVRGDFGGAAPDIFLRQVETVVGCIDGLLKNEIITADVGRVRRLHLVQLSEEILFGFDDIHLAFVDRQ